MKVFLGITAGILAFALFLQWVRLPLAHQGIWMSPDETANALSAVYYAEKGNFTLSYPLIQAYPWAVPRSFVSLEALGRIAPVGFLGMPLVLALMFKLFGITGLLFFTPVFALITLWPFWRSLPKAWNKAVRFLTLIVWMSCPAIIVYANRGAFANLAIVCSAIWLWWALAQTKGWWKWPIAGLALGLGCLLRPTEAMWLVPLAVFAHLYSQAGQTSVEHHYKIKLKEILLFVLPLVILLLGGAYLGFKTYGHWLVSGYQIRPIQTSAVQATTTVPVVAGQGIQVISIFKALPWGIHPRNIYWNAWHYLVIFSWPWTLCVVLAMYLMYCNRAWKRPEKWLLAAFGWTAFWLIIFYGNGLYQDHVVANQVSMGNSYLRYLLPLTVVAAVSTGALAQKLWRSWSLRALAICLGVFLVSMGLWNALGRDDEGMLANARELARYAQIRTETRSWLLPGTVVLSDRSDKIFFPNFMAVSPMPDFGMIRQLKEDKIATAVFLTTQDEKGLAAWQEQGLKLDLLFTNSNQSLYNVK